MKTKYEMIKDLDYIQTLLDDAFNESLLIGYDHLILRLREAAIKVMDARMYAAEIPETGNDDNDE